MRPLLDNRVLTLSVLALSMVLSVCGIVYLKTRAAIERLALMPARAAGRMDRVNASAVNLLTLVPIAFCAIVLALAGLVGYVTSIAGPPAKRPANNK